MLFKQEKMVFEEAIFSRGLLHICCPREVFTAANMEPKCDHPSQ